MQLNSASRAPSWHMIGATAEEAGEGYARMSLVLEEKHTNPNGVVHGGVLSTLMDEAAGWAVIDACAAWTRWWTAPHATVDMNVSFLTGARPGDETHRRRARVCGSAGRSPSPRRRCAHEDSET